jgi:alpha-beta hydrolase superfamily lysophospholipase
MTLMTAPIPERTRRIERMIPIGDLFPGEPFELGVRIVAPPVGTKPSGVFLYCLPGGMASSLTFDLGHADDRRFSLADAMARRGAVVLAADHPGIGASTMPRDEWTLTIQLLARAHARAARHAVEALRRGTLMESLEPIPEVLPLGCGHSMGAVAMIQQQAHDPFFEGLALLGYGRGGVLSAVPPEAVEAARDPEWLEAHLPRIARERFGTAKQDMTSRSREQGAAGSPSFHTHAADPHGRAFLREAAAPLLTLPSLFAIFPDTGLQASATIEVPILLITGTHDFVDTGEALRAQFPAVANWDQFAPEETGHNLFIFPSHPLTFERIASWADQRVEESRPQTKTVPFR